MCRIEIVTEEGALRMSQIRVLNVPTLLYFCYVLIPSIPTISSSTPFLKLFLFVMSLLIYSKNKKFSKNAIYLPILLIYLPLIGVALHYQDHRYELLIKYFIYFLLLITLHIMLENKTKKMTLKDIRDG